MNASLKCILIILVIIILPLQGLADIFPRKDRTNSPGKYVMQAACISTSPKIDGHLEKEIWESVPPATDFIQKQPDEGQLASENTEVRIIYNQDTLFIGVMCYDTEPAKIIANVKRRDSESIYENDHIQIMLDTFHDKRNGYIFVTNPLGARLDLQVRKEGKREGGHRIANPNINTDWDAVCSYGFAEKRVVSRNRDTA